MYDGKEKNLTFKKDGRTFKTQSLINDEGEQSKNPSVLLSCGKDLLHALQERESEGYFIVVKPKEREKPNQEPLPIEIQEFLGKYKDIVSDGTPATLPPKR